MINKVLVVGATGKVGSEVVNKLVAEGKEVLAGTRNPGNYETGSEKVTPVKMDLSGIELNENFLEGVDALFLIAKPLDQDAFTHLSPIVDQAVKFNVKKIVLLSAMGVDQNEKAPLRQVELYIQKSGLNYTFLRPNFFMENFYPGYVSHSIKESSQFFLPAEDEKTSFISVKDVASVGILALLNEEHNGKEYTLTGNESLDHNEVAEILSDVTGRKITYISITDEDMRKSLVAIGLPEGGIEYMSMLYSLVRAGYVAVVDPTLENLLGRSPVTFREFAEEYSSQM